MKYYTKRVNIGDTRVKSFFAVLPVKVGKENRWWERVTVLQRYEDLTPYSDEGFMCWVNIEFIDAAKGIN